MNFWSRQRPGILLGCDYNPEQWPAQTWAQDVELMALAGVDLVAVNVFGWAEIQCPDGSFDFSRLDAVLDLMHANNISVNLGTGTSSPPAWLTHQHPEILPVMSDGTTRSTGGRQAWCPSSPAFRAAALRLVNAVVERYASHPAVALWHVSNELGCHNVHCYCDVSSAAFRRWLQNRYGSIDALNDAWGTSFWSQRYHSWEEVNTPRLTVSTRNPSQLVDFARFSSAELHAYYRAELDIIRRRSTMPVTTNFMVAAHIDGLDYWEWAPDVDVIANDHYLDHRLADPQAELSFTADVARGLGGGRPWLLMEHSTGAVNWQPVNIAKTPGQMLRDSLTHVARGADLVAFFQWRASVQGSERFHSAMLPHAGTESSTWAEVCELGRVLRSLSDVVGSTVKADVAFVFSWETWWAADAENRPTTTMGYLDTVHEVHRALRDLGVGIDIVAPGSDLTGYRLAVVPHLTMVRAEDARRLDEAITAGVSVLVTYFSGIMDEDGRILTGGYPAPWRELLGIRVEEFAPLPEGAVATLRSGARAIAWTDRIAVIDADVHDFFVDGPSAGGAAVTRRRGGSGEGDAWYLGTRLLRDDLDALMSRILTSSGVTIDPDASRSVEVVTRSSVDGTDFRFVINHGTTSVTVTARGTDVVSGRTADGTLVVDAGGVAVIRTAHVAPSPSDTDLSRASLALVPVCPDSRTTTPSMKRGH